MGSEQIGEPEYIYGKPKDNMEPPPAEELKTESYRRTVTQRLAAIEKTLTDEFGHRPQFELYELDLASGARDTIEASFTPDEWVVWTRTPTAATDTLRMYPNVDVPGVGAIEIYGGKYARFPGKRSMLAFHNSGANSLHIFAAALSKAKFEIGI